MDLLLLRATPHVSIHYDQTNDWLFVDWQGHLDLPAAALASLELVRVLLRRSYQRVLISNTQVTSTNWDVPAWLAHEALPHLLLAGVAQVAWVSGRSPRAHDVAQDIFNRLPHLPIALFDDLESAVDWLRRGSTVPAETDETRPARLPATDAQLRRVMRNLICLIVNQQRQHRAQLA